MNEEHQPSRARRNIAIHLAIMAIATLVVAQVASAQGPAAQLQQLGMSQQDAERLGRLAREAMAPVIEDARWRRRLLSDPRVRRASSQAEAEAAAGVVGQELVREGLYQLPVERLRRWHELRGRMTARSQPLCAALHDGAASSALTMSALAGLPDEDVRDWFAIRAEATLAALSSDAARPRPDIDEWLQGWLAETDYATRAALLAAESGDERARCAATRAVHRSISDLRGDALERALRASASGTGPSPQGTEN